MRTIVVGTVLFVLWTVLCTCLYLRTKGYCGKQAEPALESVAEPAPEPTEAEPVPEPVVESPGSFTVYHDFDRSEVKSDDQFSPYITRLLTFLEESESASLNVIGHTDYVGGEEYNYQLGLRRAASTKNYLTGQGVPERVISTSSRGESSPAASNETADGRARNRRTEIQVIQ